MCFPFQFKTNTNAYKCNGVRAKQTFNKAWAGTIYSLVVVAICFVTYTSSLNKIIIIVVVTLASRMKFSCEVAMASSMIRWRRCWFCGIRLSIGSLYFRTITTTKTKNIPGNMLHPVHDRVIYVGGWRMATYVCDGTSFMETAFSNFYVLMRLLIALPHCCFCQLVTLLSGLGQDYLFHIRTMEFL